MGRYSSDSDSGRRHRHRNRSESSSHSVARRKHKKSKHRHRGSSNSRSRSRSISYSRSHHRRRSYSNSRSRSRSRDRRETSKRSKHKRRRRSSSSDSSRSSPRHKGRGASSREKASKKEKNIIDEAKSKFDEQEQKLLDLDMGDSARLNREKTIAEIEGDSFTQSTFVSSRSAKQTDDTKPKSDFDFGTQAEMIVREAQTNGATKPPATDDNSLFNPLLFVDPEEREEKYLRKIYNMRLKVLSSGDKFH